MDSRERVGVVVWPASERHARCTVTGTFLRPTPGGEAKTGGRVRNQIVEFTVYDLNRHPSSYGWSPFLVRPFLFSFASSLQAPSNFPLLLPPSFRRRRAGRMFRVATSALHSSSSSSLLLAHRLARGPSRAHAAHAHLLVRPPRSCERTRSAPATGGTTPAVCKFDSHACDPLPHLPVSSTVPSTRA